MAFARLLPHQFIAFNIFIRDPLQVIDDLIVALWREEVAISRLELEILIDRNALADLARCDDLAVDRLKDWEQSALGGKASDLDCVA